MDFFYDVRRPPIVGWSKRVPFTCEVCQKPGMGPPNSRVHGGKCRKQRQKGINKRAAEKRKVKLRREKMATA